MTAWLLPLAAGFGAGILSAWGVGGGTLLLLVMTLALDVPPETAATINLLYFLPTAAMGVWQHRKNGLLEKNALRAAVPWGVAAALAAALLAGHIDTDALRRPFGAYLLLSAAVTLKSAKSDKTR